MLLVIGNETCDLDSAISAISLAFFYGLQPPIEKGASTSSPAAAAAERRPELMRNIRIRPDRIMPVLNCPRESLSSKTEVLFHLKQHSIDVESVTCV